MSNASQHQTHREVTAEALSLIMNMAEAVHLSRYIKGCGSKEQAFFLMLKCWELGFPLSSAADYFDVIEGKPTLKPKGMLAIIHRNRFVFLTIRESTDQRCTMHMHRADTGFEYQITLTIQDAKRAGWVKPNGAWEKIPANMLRWRTLGFLAQLVIPDLLAGMYNSADFVEVDEEV